jgi:hypothetical protein
VSAQPHRLVRAVALALGAADLIALLAFAAYVRSSDSNHGWPMEWTCVLAACGALSAVVAGALSAVSRRLFAALVACALALAVTVFGCDRLNVMMEYDTWIARGMPER